MRDHFGVDWAFGIVGGIEAVVRSEFPAKLRLWPLLQAFNFDAFSVCDRWFVVILKDKLNGIPAGNGTLLPSLALITRRYRPRKRTSLSGNRISQRHSSFGTKTRR